MDLPMPEPTAPPLPLLQYKVLSFDVYGTLIEYKAQILNSFQPLLSRLPESSPFLDPTPVTTTVPDSASVGSVEFLKLFQRHEDAIKLEKPVKQSDEILTEIWRRIAKELEVESTDDEAKDFGSDAVISEWPTFPGTLEALKRLSLHFPLVAVSHTDENAFRVTSGSTASRLREVPWWRVFTSEDYGDDATHADDARLETLIDWCDDASIDQEEILHVAQSLGHDHAPAKRLGLSTVWIIGDGPRWGEEEESKMAVEKKLVGYAWKFQNLRDFANEVERLVRRR